MVYILNTDEDANLRKHERELSLLFSILVSTFVVIKFLYLKELRRTIDRTNFMSQNVKPSKSQLREVINNLLAEYPRDVEKFMRSKKIYTTDQLICYFQKKLKKGVCFGYAMSTIDAVSQYPYLTCRELIDKIDYSTVLKKQILTNMSYGFSHSEELQKMCYENNQSALTFLNDHHDFIQLGEETNFENIFLNLMNSEFTSLKQFSNKISDNRHYKSMSKHRLHAFFQSNLKQLSVNTVLTGHVLIDCPEFGHSIMFRASNSLYYFIDCNFGSNEYATLGQFLQGLKQHIIDYYGQGKKLEVKFNFHAVEHKQVFPVASHSKNAKAHRERFRL